MSRKKTYVNAITQRLLDTDNYISSSDYAMARYNMEQKSKLRPNIKSTSIAECLVEAHQGSMPNKFKGAYRFAKDKDKYIFGVPKSSISTDAVNDVKLALENYLTDLEGKPLTFEYVKLNSKNPYHYAWKEVISKLSYSFINNELKTLSIKEGVPAYLLKSQMYLTQESIDTLSLDGNLDQNGLNIGTIKQPEILIGDSDKLVVVYTYTKGIELLEGTVELDLSHVVKKVIVTESSDVVDEVPSEEEYLQTMYYDGTTYKLFEYKYMSGGIPEIDKAESYQEEFGQYYPRIYLRRDAKDTIELPKDNVARKNTEKLLYRLGLDLKELTTSVNESIDDLNDFYKFTFLHLTVSINKEKDDQTTGKYLFNYFDALYAKAEPILSSNPNDPKLNKEKHGITQTVSDTTYTQIVKYWKSGKETKTGIIKNNKGAALKAGEYCIKYSKMSWNTGGGKWFNNYIANHEIYFQTSANQYTVITIYGLEMIHQFYGQSVRCQWNDEGLTIPLDLSVVNGLRNKEQDLLLNKALQITVTTLQVIKKKWYETGPFKVVVAFASIAMNMFVPGSGFALSALFTAVVTTIVISVAIKILMTVAIEIAIKLGISPEVIGILTAIVVIGFTAYGAGKFDFSKMMNSKEVLKALSYSVDMYQKGIGKKIEMIKKEMDTFNEYAKDEWKKIETAQSMLFTGMIPPGLELLTSPINEVDIYLGESPQDFYTRTVGLDIVDMSYNMEAYFLALATTVPKNTPKRVNTVDISDVLLIN